MVCGPRELTDGGSRQFERHGRCVSDQLEQPPRLGRGRKGAGGAVDSPHHLLGVAAEAGRILALCRRQVGQT